MNPASFRANTKMPTFCSLENFVNVSGDHKPTKAQAEMNRRGRIENDVMINAIVAYLFEKSKPAPVPPAPGRGDVARGEKLIAERRCFGCHIIDARPDAPRRPAGASRQLRPNR